MVNFLTLLLVWITVDPFRFLLKMAVRAAVFFGEGRVGTESEAYPTRLMNDVVCHRLYTKERGDVIMEKNFSPAF